MDSHDGHAALGVRARHPVNGDPLQSITAFWHCLGLAVTVAEVPEGLPGIGRVLTARRAFHLSSRRSGPVGPSPSVGMIPTIIPPAPFSGRGSFRQTLLDTLRALYRLLRPSESSVRLLWPSGPVPRPVILP